MAFEIINFWFIIKLLWKEYTGDFYDMTHMDLKWKWLQESPHDGLLSCIFKWCLGDINYISITWTLLSLSVVLELSDLRIMWFSSATVIGPDYSLIKLISQVIVTACWMKCLLGPSRKGTLFFFCESYY